MQFAWSTTVHTDPPLQKDAPQGQKPQHRDYGRLLCLQGVTVMRQYRLLPVFRVPRVVGCRRGIQMNLVVIGALPTTRMIAVFVHHGIRVEAEVVRLHINDFHLRLYIQFLHCCQIVY